MSRRLLLMPSVHRPPVAVPPSPAEAPASTETDLLDDDLRRYRRPAFQPGCHDEAVLAALVVPPGAPTIAAGYARMEANVMAQLRALPPAGRLALRRRLEAPHPDDPLPRALGRLCAERRARLQRVLQAPAAATLAA